MESVNNEEEFYILNLFIPFLSKSLHLESPYWFAGDTITKHHKLGGLTTEIYILTVLEARNLGARYRQG